MQRKTEGPVTGGRPSDCEQGAGAHNPFGAEAKALSAQGNMPLHAATSSAPAFHEPPPAVKARKARSLIARLRDAIGNLGGGSSRGAAVADLEMLLASERARAEFAWQNSRFFEQAYRDERAKREVMEGENKRLRESLVPFSDIHAARTDAVPDDAAFASRSNGTHVTYGDIRRARKLLAKAG